MICTESNKWWLDSQATDEDLIHKTPYYISIAIPFSSERHNIFVNRLKEVPAKTWTPHRQGMHRSSLCAQRRTWSTGVMAK